MTYIRRILPLLLFAWPIVLGAQEVRYIDLTSIKQRTELRHPTPPPSNYHGLGSGAGGVSMVDGASDRRDPHALGVYLLQVNPTDINPAEPFEVEFQLRNTGTVPIEVPIWPHLSDLQPADESKAFTYLSLALVVSVVTEPHSQNGSPFGGFVELYGKSEDQRTILVLRPGEWIRVRANVKLLKWPPEPISAFLRGTFWLRKNVLRPQPGGEFTDVRNLDPNTTLTPSIEVHLLRPTPSSKPNK